MKLNDKINETLLFEDGKKYNKMQTINKVFAIIVSVFPAILNISKKLIPNLLVDIFCAIWIFLPHVIEKKYGIIILEEFRFLIIFHSMLHTVFGKAFHFYDKYPLYDDILHILGGGLLALIFFSIFFSTELHYSKHKKHTIVYKSKLITLNMVNTIGVGWEILEFLGDLVFRGIPGYRIAQEDSLFDTMTDLIENNIGAFLALFIFSKIIKKFEENGRNMEDLFKALIPDPCTVEKYLNNINI